MTGEESRKHAWEKAGPAVRRPFAVDLPAVEQEVARRWEAGDVPGQTLARNAGRPTWTCLQQPSEAGGVPGLHHLPAAVVADMYQRLRTMQGFQVVRRRGWDCHGLTVEVA